MYIIIVSYRSYGNERDQPRCLTDRDLKRQLFLDTHLVGVLIFLFSFFFFLFPRTGIAFNLLRGSGVC